MYLMNKFFARGAAEGYYLVRIGMHMNDGDKQYPGKVSARGTAKGC